MQATALLDQLPTAAQVLNSLVQSLASKCSEIPTVEKALAHASEAGLASRLRLAVCACTRQTYMSGVDRDAQVACNES